MSALETFGALVAPHDPQEFLERFWGRQPVLIPALPERSRRWPVTIEELNRLFQDTRAIAPALRPWRLVGPDNKIAEPEPELDLIEVVTNAGTVCFDDIEHHSPAIAGLVSDLKVALSHPGRIFVSTYVSGRSGGFAHHLDYHPVFVVQLAGSKHWTYGHHPEVPWSPVIIANPRNAVDAEARFPWLQASYPTSDTAGLAECELAEGGVLYLPAGTWHQARATSDLSVALSIACVPLTVADLVDDLIRGYLGPREPWRASIPPVLCTNDLPSDQLPEPVSRFLADRIAELQAVVNTLTPADLYPAWAEHVSTSAAPRRPTPDLGAAVGSDDQLVIADDAPVRIVHDHTTLRLYYRDTRVDLDPRALPLVTRLCDQRRFQVADVISWHGRHREADIRRVLIALTESGILHRAH